MEYLHIVIPSVLILGALITVIAFHYKKKSVLKKVRSLSINEKQSKLDALAEPFGYCYDLQQDVFTSRLDAPQKIFGYNTLFDISAPYFNMIFDYETIYFDYDSRTWLMEMWKGQYGINSGCEIGLYYADNIIPPRDYSSTHFTSVEEKDMLQMTYELYKIPQKGKYLPDLIGKAGRRHWWLTLFKPGLYSKPEQLYMNVSLRFKDYPMMYSFLRSFEKSPTDIPFSINGLTVSFTYKYSKRQYSFYKRLVRRLALNSCRIYCKLFNFLTRNFTNSGDKILYLYYYLPVFIRMMFKQKKHK